MIGALRKVTDRILGRGEAALTVPPLDGAWKPNNRLEEAPPGLSAVAPQALVLWQGRPHWAEGAQLQNESGRVADYAAPITAMAAGPARGLALALAGLGVEIAGAIPDPLRGLDCVTAMAFEGGDLWIAQGSTEFAHKDWLQDYMALNAKGRLLRYDVARNTLVVVAQGLGYPYGLLVRNGGVLLSEAWQKRLVFVDRQGGRKVLLDDLPGYPAGLCASATGGVWLAVFAPRSPLLELVLREPTYRRAMMAEVEPEFWISPALRSGYSFHEPMQGGALKQMGVLKPWAPTRSYGLVVELGPEGAALQSLHSRAGGRRHGVTSVLDHGGRLWCAVTGGDEILPVQLGGEA